MTTPNPQIIRLKAELPGTTIVELVEEVLGLAEKAGMAEPLTFESPIGSAPKPLERLDTARLAQPQVEFALGDGARLAISTYPGPTGSLLECYRTGHKGLTEADTRAAQTQQTNLLRALFETGKLETGNVERLEEGLDALAGAPLARLLPAVLVTEAQVEKAYADPSPFWAAWDEDLKNEGRHLLSRHLDAGSSADWFRACFEDQWAMARAARPGDTFFGGLVAPPGCEDILMKGDGRLRQTGYRDGLVELAGFVPEGAHVPPWEILTWSDVLLRGSLDDGSPVSALQVVFRNEEMARREATPFIDMGATVAFLGRDGAYHPVQ